MTKHHVITLASSLLLLLALLACKKGSEGGSPSAESKTPNAPAANAPGAAAPTGTAGATAPTKLKFKVEGVPDIPSEKSNPPQGAEWDQGIPVNTQGANARGKQCSMHVLREWLRIYCSGKVIGYEKKEDFGQETVDYFEKIVPGKYASFVIRLKKGKNQKIRICRENDRASLFVSWPPSTDKPKNIALGTGPVCDGSDWGAGYGKKGGDAYKAPVGEAEADAEQTRINLHMQEEAKAACKGGDPDACIFACGERSCP